MPVVVLTASVKFAELCPSTSTRAWCPRTTPRDFGAVIDRTNTAAQTELAGYFPGSEHITDTNSGHNIMVDNAPVVIKAIEDVLAAVRAGRTTLTGGDDHLAAAIEVDGRKPVPRVQRHREPDGGPAVRLRERRRHLEPHRHDVAGGVPRPRRDQPGLHLRPARIDDHHDERERDPDPGRDGPPGPQRLGTHAP